MNDCGFSGVTPRNSQRISANLPGYPLFVKKELVLIESPARTVRAFCSLHDPKLWVSKPQSDYTLNNISRYDIIYGSANCHWRITYG